MIDCRLLHKLARHYLTLDLPERAADVYRQIMRSRGSARRCLQSSGSGGVAVDNFVSM
jgi:hypothetical protein